MKKAQLKKIDENLFELDCTLIVEFENEVDAYNEEFSFTTSLSFPENTIQRFSKKNWKKQLLSKLFLK